MTAVDTLRTALYGNPPNDGFKPDRGGVLTAFSELFEQVRNLVSGVVSYATVADLSIALSGDGSAPVGTQARVYADPTSTNNTYWIRTGSAGTSADWEIDLDLITSISTIVQPLVDLAHGYADAAAASATAAAAAVVGAVKGSLSISPYYVGFGTPSGNVIPVIDRNGYLVSITKAGTVDRAVTSFTLWGSNGISPGMVEGELITRWFVDKEKGVREAYTSEGGHFVETVGGLVRVGDNVFARKSPITSYLGQTYSAGVQNLAFRPSTMATSTLTIPTVTTAYIFAALGQSNSDGQNNDIVTDSLISGTAVYPNYALMLEGTGGPRGRLITGNATLVPLIETVVNAGSGSYQQETPVSGWVNHFIRDYYALWSEYPTVVGISAATGGRGYIGNNRGQESWRYLERSLALATQALKNRGFNNIEVVLAWVGSEGDSDTTYMNDLRFANQMRQLRRFANDTVRRIVNPVADPPMLFIQPSNVKSTPTALPWSQPVRDVMVKMDAEQGFTLAGPAYYLPMSSGDVIHRNNLGKYTTGQTLARATMYEVLGATWHGVKPVRGYFSGAAEITVEFDGMGTGLVLDSSGTISATGLDNQGFMFDDGSGASPTITNVAVSTYNVVITLASAPTGPRKRLGYALVRNAGTPYQDGPTVGARGTLRDSAAHVRISDGANQYDWCPAFILNF